MVKKKKKTIFLDKRGVQTRAGEKSSEVSRETQAARKEESRVRSTKSGRAKITAAKKSSKSKSPIQFLSKETRKGKAIDEIKSSTRFSEVKDAGVEGSDFGKRKREIFAEEHPIQKGILDVAASSAFYGAVGVGAGAAISAAAKAKTAVATTEALNTYRSTLGLSKMSGTASNVVRGKLVSIPGQVTNFASKTAPAAGNFANNAKTVSLTKKLLIGAGFSLAAASLAKDLFGTYPFASFGKEETLQSVGFVMTQAINAGLYEDAQGVLDASNEIINKAPTLADKIPYANVQKEFQRYITQQGENNKVWQEIIDKKIRENTGEIETDFAKSRREGDEASEERDLEAMRFKSEYYALIREGKFEEAEELLAAQG